MSSGCALGANMYWFSGLHLYTPLPFRPGKGGFGDNFRMHFFMNAGNLANSSMKNHFSLLFSLVLFQWQQEDKFQFFYWSCHISCTLDSGSSQSRWSWQYSHFIATLFFTTCLYVWLILRDWNENFNERLYHLIGSLLSLCWYCWRLSHASWLISRVLIHKLKLQKSLYCK